MINIKIDDELAFIEVNDGNRSYQKATTLEKVQEAIGIKDKSFDSELLPGKYGTKQIKETSNYKRIVYLHPPERRRVHKSSYDRINYTDNHGYTEEDYERVGYDRLGRTDAEYEEYLMENWNTIVHKLERIGIYSETEMYDIMLPEALVYAIKDSHARGWGIQLYTLGGQSVLTGDETLYRYPAPNIFDSGNICWGENEYEGVFPNFSFVQGIVPKFLSSTFNDDLVEYRIRNMSIDRFWKEMDTAFNNGATEEEVLSMYEGKYFETHKTINNLMDNR